jgi:D-serine dehydratase
MIGDKTREGWIQAYPLLEDILAKKEVAWANPRYDAFESAQRGVPLSETHIRDAEERLRRFAPYIARVFPETRPTGGLIESPLVEIPAMRHRLLKGLGWKTAGTLLLKCDSHLPISGSIKARGGIYEVLKHVEDLALEHGLLTLSDHYAVLDSSRCRQLFAHYAIAVGSTGNLGLSIGIMGSALGFQVVVHMSSDAKSWKKELLRQKGVTVIEHRSDYSKAVEEGRKEAGLDPKRASPSSNIDPTIARRSRREEKRQASIQTCTLWTMNAPPTSFWAMPLPRRGYRANWRSSVSP